MLTDSERLDRLETVIEELIERSNSEPVIVEGPRDLRAMRRLGIRGLVYTMNTGNSVTNFCQTLSAEFDRVIILTDWDRKGGHLAQLLRKGFEACDVKYDDQIRRKITLLTKRDVKDVEGLPAYIGHMRSSLKSGERTSRRASSKIEKD